MELKIEIVNLAEIRAALMQSPEIVSKHINRAINQAIVIDLSNALVDTTPVRTSHLAGGNKRGIKFGNLYGEINNITEYAMAVHEGHRQTPGRYVHAIGKRLVKSFVKGKPFMKNAISQVQDRINKRFEIGLSEALNEIAGKIK